MTVHVGLQNEGGCNGKLGWKTTKQCGSSGLVFFRVWDARENVCMNDMKEELNNGKRTYNYSTTLNNKPK